MKGVVQRGRVLLLSLLLVACAVPYRVPMNEDAKASIQNVRVVLAANNEAVVPLLPNYHGAAGGMYQFGFIGGLVGGLVVSAIHATQERNANQALAGVNSVFPSLKFESLVVDSLQSAMVQAPFKISNVEATKTLAPLTKSTREAMTDDAQLNVRATCFISRDGQSLVIASWAEMWSKISKSDPTKRGDSRSRASSGLPDTHYENALYKNIIVYQASLSEKPKSLSDAANAWLADDSRLLKQAVLEGSKAVAELLARDVSEGSHKGSYPDKLAFGPNRLSAKIESQNGDRKLYRLESGELYSMSGGGVLEFKLP